MDEQQRQDERGYYLELEELLARFHHDLARVHATAVAIHDDDIAEDLMRAMWNIGCACGGASDRQASLRVAVDDRA